MTSAVLDQTSYSASPTKRRVRSPLTIRELLTPVFYYMRHAILAFLLPVLAACIAIFFAHTVFVAQSRLLILLGGDYVFKASVADPGSAQSFDRSQIVHAEMEILSSRGVRSDALKAIGLARVYPKLVAEPQGFAKGVDQLEKDLTVENIPTSNVIELKLKAGDPKVAADLLNKLVEVYQIRRNEVFKRADPATVSVQRDVLRQRLSQVEAQITDFSTRYGFGDYGQEFNAVQSQQALLQGQLQSLDQQIATRAGRANQLSILNRSTPQEIQVFTDRSRSTAMEGLMQNLVALQAQRREAAEKYREGYPLLADLDARIARVQAEMRQVPAQQVSVERRGLNPVHQQIDTELADSFGDVAGLRNGRAALTQALDRVASRLEDLVRIGPEYRELIRARTVVESALQDLDRTVEDGSLANSTARSRANVRVIQPAEPPTRGKAGRSLILLAGCLAGLITALATVLVASALSEVMVTPRDLEDKVGVPVLLSVALNDDILPRRPGRLSPTRLSQDEGRLLLRIMSTLRNTGGSVMQLISAHEGEGVSNLARDLAAIAVSGGMRKVLLLDIEPPDGRGAAAMFAAQGQPLTPVSPERRTLQVGDTTLYVSAPIGAGGLKVEEAKWGKIIQAARTSFDLILIDSPAFERSSAGIEVAGLADATLVVVEAEMTRAAVARRLVDQIDDAGGQVIGAVLNKRSFYIPRWLYRSL
ncbi:MAG: hypothetical protein CGW95_00245 [Phenylobacterium zucineum]|nr:MAG: hypothetical protein CGW95_00245 [Phenylobacterium zucineum]